MEVYTKNNPNEKLARGKKKKMVRIKYKGGWWRGRKKSKGIEYEIYEI